MSRWCQLREACSVLGLSAKALQRRAQRGEIQRRELSTWAGHYEYLIDEDGSTEIPTRKPSSENIDVEIPVESTERYYFDKHRDVYVFNLPSKRAVFPMSGTDVRALVYAYSSVSGEHASLNELARRFEMRVQTVREILASLQKTHTSAPYTDEHIANTDEETMVEDLVRAKEERILVAAERKRWNDVKKMAEQAESMDRFILRRLETMSFPRPEQPKPVKLKSKVSPFDAVLSATDLHYGKLGYIDEVGEEYNREITRRRLFDRTDDLLARLLSYGVPERWIVGVGSDWFHVDNMRNSTTRGTPQDADGTYTKILIEGLELKKAYIQHLRQYAPVLLMQMAGNHDEQTSYFAMLYLAESFRGAKDVESVVSFKPRQYTQFGNCLLGLAHGDGAKMNELPRLMASEMREEWGRSRHRIWVTGNFHFEMSKDIYGCQIYQMPSLSGTDRWHAKEGYVGSNKSLMAYCIDHSEGVVATFTSTVQ